MSGVSTSTSTPTLPTLAATKSSASMAPSVDAERGRADLTLPRRPWRLHPTPWASILAHPYKGAGTEADPFIVSWLEVDGEHPRQFSTLHKWVTTIIAAMGTLAVTMGSSILSAAITSVRADFPGYNDMTYIMVTGIYILGFVLGPFLWGPFSEVMGRRTTYVASFVPFTLFDAGVCAAPNMHGLLALRFIAGVFGCSGMTNAGGVIADMFEAQQRGMAMGVFGAVSPHPPASRRTRCSRRLCLLTLSRRTKLLTPRCPGPGPASDRSSAASSATRPAGGGWRRRRACSSRS